MYETVQTEIVNLSNLKYCFNNYNMLEPNILLSSDSLHELFPS